MKEKLSRTGLILALIFLLTPSYQGQSIKTAAENELALRKDSLTNDLQALDLQSLKIDGVARARAKAEIAGAAWLLDEEWAKTLLREAYKLTLPNEEGANSAAFPTRSESASPANNDRAANEVRNRIMAIASRDKNFADQLTKLGASLLGKSETHVRYANLAARALQAGDTDSAGKYIIQSIDADPTQLTAPFQIISLAAKDRAAADNLIIQYIERLRLVPLLDVSQFMTRTGFLASLVFPPPGSDRPTAPPGAAVMRAYVIYIIESVTRLAENQPETVPQTRGLLMTAWMPLQRYAPELTGVFLQLESLSRRPGETVSLPTQKVGEESTNNYEKRVKDALESGHPDDFIILSAISRRDFDNARRMIDKLDEGLRKSQLIELVNMREAISLSGKGDILGAERLAKQLKKATSILNVYPAIVRMCATKKDQVCVTNLINQAIKQLKTSDPVPQTALLGIPASFLPTSSQFDPVLASLFELAKTVAPIDDLLAFQLLDESVRAANRSELDTKQGFAGIESDVFRMLAMKNEERVRQAASELKDPLRQIIATAVIYQWKAEELQAAIRATKN